MGRLKIIAAGWPEPGRWPRPMLPGVTQAPDPVAPTTAAAWDREVEKGNLWRRSRSAPRSSPGHEARGRVGGPDADPAPCPLDWFPAPLPGLDVLCLASSGGQQAPVLAAAGAAVTVLDNSPSAARDRLVADRDGLELRHGGRRHAGPVRVPDASFDVVFNPVSNCSAPTWRPSGASRSGSCGPAAS